VKPFRGKPEKPERSTGEIQSPRRVAGRRSVRGDAAARAAGPSRSRSRGVASPPTVRARAGGVHFSPCRTSRPVGCRSKARADARAASVLRPVRPRGPAVTRPAARRQDSGRRWVAARSERPGPRQARPRSRGARTEGPASRAGRRQPRRPRTDPARPSATLQLRVVTGPVLKHGPRSLARARVTGTAQTQRRNESEGDRSFASGPREDGRRRARRPALPGRLALIARRGAPRARAPGPERW
jgi:hypothetical protein